MFLDYVFKDEFLGGNRDSCRGVLLAGRGFSVFALVLVLAAVLAVFLMYGRVEVFPKTCRCVGGEIWIEEIAYWANRSDSVSFTVAVRNVGSVDAVLTVIRIVDISENRTVKIWVGNITIKPGEVREIGLDFKPVFEHYYVVEAYTRSCFKDSKLYPLHWKIPSP